MKRMYFCGSFNPLHHGHIKAAEYFWDEYRVIFCQCVKPYNKPAQEFNREQFENYGLEYMVLEGRSFYSHYKSITTGMHIDMLVGLDTYLNIINPAYYLDSEGLMKRVLSRINATFHVVPRDGSGFVETDLINAVFYEDFSPINISSTMIRNEKWKKSQLH